MVTTSLRDEPLPQQAHVRSVSLVECSSQLPPRRTSGSNKEWNEFNWSRINNEAPKGITQWLEPESLGVENQPMLRWTCGMGVAMVHLRMVTHICSMATRAAIDHTTFHSARPQRKSFLRLQGSTTTWKQLKPSANCEIDA